MCCYLLLPLELNGQSHEHTDVPQLTFGHMIHDFGVMKQGEKKTHIFSFQNLGSEPVHILGLQTECGCTAAHLEKSRFEPQEEGELAITFDSSLFNGKVSKTVLVMTSEPHISERLLVIKADVMSEFVVDPPLVDFGTIVSGGSVILSKKFSVLAVKKGLTLDLNRMTYSKDLFSVAGRKNGRRWEFDVRMKGYLKAGMHREIVLLRTNSHAMNRIPIPVIFEVKSSMSHSPEYLDFGQLKFQSSVKKTLLIKSSRPLEVSSLATDAIVNGEPVGRVDEMVEVRLNEHEEGSKLIHVSITLKNRLASHAGALHGQLHFKSKGVDDRLAVDFYALLLEQKGDR